MKNNVDKQYLELLQDILDNGVWKEGRNGRVKSVFGRTFRHDMREGFPLLTTKKMYFKGIRTELEWFLNGSHNIKPLVDQGNNIWVGDAYKYYINKPDDHFDDTLTEEQFIEKIKTDDEFAEEWGDMGPIYGKQWRDWGNWVVDELENIFQKQLDDDRERWKHKSDKERLQRSKSSSDRLFAIKEVKENSPNVDQIKQLIDKLINTPDSRRMLVSAWNVSDLDKMKLPPCHYGFSVWTRELTDEEKKKYNTGVYKKERGITLMWRQRSVDTPLGFPFNLASYGLLLEMIADEVSMVPLELIGSLEDTHIYENQIEGVKKQLKRKSHPLPSIHIRDGIWSRGDEDIILDNYVSEDKVYYPLSN